MQPFSHLWPLVLSLYSTIQIDSGIFFLNIAHEFHRFHISLEVPSKNFLLFLQYLKAQLRSTSKSYKIIILLQICMSGIITHSSFLFFSYLINLQNILCIPTLIIVNASSLQIFLPNYPNHCYFQILGTYSDPNLKIFCCLQSAILRCLLLSHDNFHQF